MNKREFIMQFILNRCMAGNVSTDSLFWIEQANIAWDSINVCAPLVVSMEPDTYELRNTAAGVNTNTI